MDINVKINKLIENDNTKIKAMATIELDNMVRITNIKVVDGEKGLFISYPQREKNKQYENLIEFNNTDKGKSLRENLKNSIIEEYNKSLKDQTLVGYGSNYTAEEKEIAKEIAKDNLEKIQVFINAEDSYGKQKAKGEILIDEAISLKGIRIMSDSEDKLFIAMPSESYQKNGKEEYNNIFYGLTYEVRENITKKAMQSYQRSIEFLENTNDELEEQEM